MKLAPCSSCGASMIWVITQAGSPMPIDELAVPDGNLLLIPAINPDDPPSVKYLSGIERMSLAADAGEQGHIATFYVSHFATCPDGPAHRRKKNRRSP